jgi:hypothetical protein
MNSWAAVVFICCVNDEDRKGRVFQDSDSYLSDNTVSRRTKRLSSQPALHEQQLSSCHLYLRREKAVDKLLPSIGLYSNCSCESCTVLTSVHHARTNTNWNVPSFQTWSERVRPTLWSSGQSSWQQTRRPGFDSRHFQIFWVGGGGRGKQNGVHSAT